MHRTSSAYVTRKYMKFGTWTDAYFQQQYRIRPTTLGSRLDEGLISTTSYKISMMTKTCHDEFHTALSMTWFSFKRLLLGCIRSRQQEQTHKLEKIFFFFKNCRPAPGLPSPLFDTHRGGSFPDSKAAGSWRWSAVEHENAWSCTSTSTCAFMECKGGRFAFIVTCKNTSQHNCAWSEMSWVHSHHNYIHAYHNVVSLG